MINFTSAVRPKYNKYVFSIAHKDYTKDVGGVEKLIKEHSELFRNNSISYVFVCPLRFDSGIYKFYIDDKYIGAFSIKTICRWLKSWPDTLLQVQIHHIIHWVQRDIEYLMCTIEAPILVYLHDYFYMCPHYNLIDSSGEFCGDGVASPNKCVKCDFYSKEIDKISFNKNLLSLYLNNNAVFIAPSEFVRTFWIKSFPQFKYRTYVVEHLVLSEKTIIEKKCKSPYRIAYIGAQYDIKGWPVYEKLYDALKNDMRYSFYHFGIARKQLDKMQVVPVSFQKDGKDAMKNAIIKENIDFAIFFPQWPETYNYTCYEAYMGGAFLCCNTISGNIQDMVNKYRCGVVFDSKEELISFFETCEAIEQLKKYREATNRYVPKCANPNSSILNYVDLNQKTKINAKRLFMAMENYEGVVYKIKSVLKNLYRQRKKK